MPSTRKTADQAADEIISGQPEAAADSGTVTAAAEQAAPAMTNAQIDNEAKSMKDILDARPKVRVKIIDRNAAEAGTTPPPHPVGINGYIFRVPWNKPVEVPDRVADILERQGLC